MPLMTEVDVAYGAIVFVKQLNGERENISFFFFKLFLQKNSCFFLLCAECWQRGTGLAVSANEPHQGVFWSFKF